jgi:hypothetical protein
MGRHIALRPGFFYPEPMTLSASLRIAALILTLVGCAPILAPLQPEFLTPPPVGIREVTVVPPNNRTGTALVVNDPGLLTKMFEEKTTVPQVLAADLRAGLVQRGYQVEHVSKDAPKLQVEIRRWQHYSADYSQVTVDLTAVLESSAGRLWSVERTNWRIGTAGSSSSIDASNAASEAIADALLEGWQAGTPDTK